MNNIQIKILNPEAIKTAEKMMVCAARLTQRGHKIKSLQEFMDLYQKPYTEKTIKAFVNLPHPTIQKFAVINIAVVGASRRFLAQITRHQNEVKFMSASLQYSDYSGEAAFTVPYDFIERKAADEYIEAQRKAMDYYADAIDAGIGNDAAGYLAPQGLRNALLISATPYQWKHMISQRTCRRNTEETQYVMLRIWEALKEASPALFSGCGPFCLQDGCKEGKMRCDIPAASLGADPGDLLRGYFPLLMEDKKDE